MEFWELRQMRALPLEKNVLEYIGISYEGGEQS